MNKPPSSGRRISHKPKIGIVVCGFIDNRQFVTNAYIQSVRYSGGIPLILPLIRSDRISFLRRQRYYTSSFRTRTQKWKWENQHHSGSFSDPPYETAPPDRKTVSLHLPGHAGIQCRLRRKHLSGSFPPSGRTSGSYAAILFPGRDQS